MRVGLFLKYDREIGKWSKNREIPDLWGRVDRYALTAARVFHTCHCNIHVSKCQKGDD